MLLLCLILSTQILAQPGLFDRWSLERIFEGWSFHFFEPAATALAMLGGFVLAEAITQNGSARRALAVAVAFLRSCASVPFPP